MLQEHGVKISMDGKRRYTDNIFVERLWRTVKYGEVYLKAYASEARRELGAYFRFYNGQSPIKPWATGPRPRCSGGSRKSGKSLMTGVVHSGQGQYYWQERRDSHLTLP